MLPCAAVKFYVGIFTFYFRGSLRCFNTQNTPLFYGLAGVRCCRLETAKFSQSQGRSYSYGMDGKLMVQPAIKALISDFASYQASVEPDKLPLFSAKKMKPHKRETSQS